MFDSTAEREAWEAEVRGVVYKAISEWLGNRTIAQIVEATVDEAIDERVSKQYSFYNINPDDLVTGRHLDTLMGSLNWSHERIEALETWRNTRWHAKAGRALKSAWEKWLRATLLILMLMFAGWCVGEVLQGWLL